MGRSTRAHKNPDYYGVVASELYVDEIVDCGYMVSVRVHACQCILGARFTHYNSLCRVKARAVVQERELKPLAKRRKILSSHVKGERDLQWASNVQRILRSTIHYSKKKAVCCSGLHQVTVDMMPKVTNFRILHIITNGCKRFSALHAFYRSSQKRHRKYPPHFLAISRYLNK